MPSPRVRLRLAGALLERVLELPAFTWVFLAFLIVFVYYFLKPTFLNPYHEIELFQNFPVMNPIGGDLREYLGFTRALLQNGSPYIGPNYYPPLESVFFIPLTWTTQDRAYLYLTLINMGLFCGITLVFPALVSTGRRVSSMLIFFLMAGLFSYGFLFQLERGQYDIIVMALCFGALYLYHCHPRARFLAYFLFVVSVQIKVYPGIFLILFSTDWHDWKPNLRRWGALLLVNFAALFGLGSRVFADFIAALQKQLSYPTFVWIGNHSINSFVTIVVRKINAHGALTKPVFQEYMTLIQLALMVFFFACLAVVAWIVYKKRMSPFNPYLLIMCTIGAMVLPSTSHDYVFAGFIAPFAIFFNSLRLQRSSKLWVDIFSVLLVFVMALAYLATFFLHNNQPLLLNSNLPALLLIGAITPILMALRGQQVE